jgi:hypothetical protein
MANEYVAVWDYGSEAEISSNNELVVYENADAVNNALLMWFKTEEGEVLNNPNDGGSPFKQLFKNFSESNRMKLLFSTRSDIDNYFFPKIKILELSLTEDTTLKEWKLRLKYYIESYNVTKTTDLPLRRLKVKSIFEEMSENVAYTGTTLENFIKIYLYEQRNISLKWNGTYWVWGRFIFTQLSEDDSNFEKLQIMIDSNRDS